MISIRGGAGLGDALYVQAIARHLVDKGNEVEACSDWPDIFGPLGPQVTVSPFRRERINVLAHYSMRRAKAGTTQFEDCCIQAGVDKAIPLRLDWKPRTSALINSLKSSAKPVILIQMPRAPFGRRDGFGLELMPNWRRLQDAIDAIGDRANTIMVGAGKAVYRLGGAKIDLSNKTSIRELIDLAAVADGFLGYCSFFVPLAECFDRPSLLVWSRRGLRSSQPIIRQITPQKVFHKSSSCAVIDDCDASEIVRATDALLDAARTKTLV